MFLNELYIYFIYILFCFRLILMNTYELELLLIIINQFNFIY